MKKSTFNILFFIKHTRLNKNGSCPIYARITITGKRAEFSIQREVEVDMWDGETNRAKGISKTAKEINDRIDFVKRKLNEHRVYLEDRNITITAFTLRDKYMGLDYSSKGILEVFQDHNDKCKGLVNIDFAPGTVERYITSRKHVADFIKMKYKRNDLGLNEITPMFINDFEYYLKIERKCIHNTATKYIKNFKKIIRIALANGWMKADPFSNIKFRLDDVDMAYLNDAELEKLMKKQFRVDRLQQVKDIYVFCCFTGLAFIDVKNLKYEDIEEKNGQMWIKKKRQKTKNWCSIPLLGPATELIEKYRNHPICVKTGVVLPVVSNQKLNEYMREIADLCEIDKKLTCHTARHTFATTVTLANQISMEVVSKMLGHSSINMTKRYARVVDELIDRDMKKLYGKYDAIMVN